MKVIKHKTDVCIIGFGSAGMRAFRAATKAGKKALIVHDGPYGTSCARNGCMPSKLLIAAANAAFDAKHAEIFGVHPREVVVDEAHVMQRVRHLRDMFVSHVLEKVEAIPEAQRICGKAHFVSDHVIAVGDDVHIEAKTFVIATGSTALVPPNFPKDCDRIITNEEVFLWEKLPKSIAVFGTGVIGLELGQALVRLGVRTTVFGRSGQVSSMSDPELCTIATEIFRQEMDIYPQPTIHSMTPEDNGVRIKFRSFDGHEHDIHYDYVLSAVGRRPNLDTLKLENTSLTLDKRGMPTFDPQTTQCGESNIFIAGDANGFRSLLHEAADEGDIAGANAAAFPTVKKFKRKVSLGIVFTDPEMITVGTMFAELPSGGFVTGEMDFARQARAEMINKNRGKLHVYIDKKTQHLLGAEMIGPHAEHIAHLLAWAIEMEMTLDQLLKMPFYHPTVEEGLRGALQHAAKQLAKPKE